MILASTRVFGYIFTISENLLFLIGCGLLVMTYHYLYHMMTSLDILKKDIRIDAEIKIHDYKI